MKSKFVLVSLIIALSGCTQDDKSDVGYGDGYAVGYNTTCKIRVTLIEGDWENESYSKAYHQGYQAGSVACKNKNL
jgi:hypothetical protein